MLTLILKGGSISTVDLLVSVGDFFFWAMTGPFV